MGKRINWEKVGELTEKIKGQGLSLAEGARAFGTPVRQLYELSRRQNVSYPESEEAVGQAAKAEVQRTVTEGDNDAIGNEVGCFKLSPLPEELQRLIIQYRTENPDAGFKRIEDRLKGEHLVVVGRKQIRHVLKIHGLLKGHDSSFDRPAM